MNLNEKHKTLKFINQFNLVQMFFFNILSSGRQSYVHTEFLPVQGRNDTFGSDLVALLSTSYKLLHHLLWITRARATDKPSFPQPILSPVEAV